MNRTSVVRVLSVVGIAALALVGVVAVSAQDATPVPPVLNPGDFPENTITVSGIGTASGEPNIAYIELGVEVLNANLAEAYAEAATTMTAVIDALVDAGVAREDVRTSSVNIYPQDNFDPQTGQPTDRSYRVSNTVRVTARDVSMVETIINTAVGAGANSIYNFNFAIEDTAAVESQAREAAVANARQRAEQLASLLGVTVGEPVVITESGGVQPIIPLPYAGGGASFDMAQANSLPVASGQLNVSVQILVTFRINQ